jgi:dihydrofolate synthase/folylpolyglutamate synthase
MPIIRNFEEAHTALHEFYGLPGAKREYKLDRMRALMEYLGNPQESLKIVHVAGTSGKTSTCYYISALLEAAGANVGLSVSPHVDEVNERVQINHTPLPEVAFCESLGEFIELIQGSELRPSYFELMIAFAFWKFARMNVDYAVIEVGLGGLLDGTNVVERSDKVCVITDIGLDHTEVLGDTLAKIAAQKAGIIQSQTHVFVYDQGQEVMTPIRARVAAQHAIVHEIAPRALHAASAMPLFQQRNLFLAEQAVKYVVARDGRGPLTPQQIQAAAAVCIPARMEQFHVGDKTIIIDGSHNAQKIATLAESMHAKFRDKPIVALVSFVQDKDERWQGGLDALSSLTKQLIITAYAADQDLPKTSMDPNTVATYCQEHGFTMIVEPNPQAAFAKLLQRPESILLVVGSFYLLNAIRPLVLERK